MRSKREFGWCWGLGFVAIVAATAACTDDDKGKVTGDASTNDAGGGTGDGGGTSDGGLSDGGALGNCVEVAQANGNFTTLLKAATDQGLAGALSGAGPFTIFAPTDDAFDALKQELADDDDPSNDDLLDTAAVKSVLEYHVLDSKVTAAEVSALPAPGVVKNTLLGVSLFAQVKDAKVTINDRATVTTADVACSNGVIHVIDKVLLPLNTAEAATVAGEFTILVDAVVGAGLAGALTDPASPVTVFAPTDAAFDAAGLTAMDATANILTYHAVSGSKLSTSLTSGDLATLLPNKSLTIAVSNTGVTVNGAMVVIADIVTTSGVIHVIDKVLDPESEGVFPPK